jgi:hypothetical protein
MKATMEIPDELYRRVKAKSALRGEPLREVAERLFQGWVSEPDSISDAPGPATAETGLPGWFGMARPFVRRTASHDLAHIRQSIARGRAGHAATP